MNANALHTEIESGELDTVLVVFPDMQGRLLGKRVSSHFFLTHAQREGHACDYLLATDMEMETVPGFEAASWSKGYGDFVMRPDLSTLRRLPWLEGTAMVICDITDHHGKLAPHAPRSVLKKQVERLSAQGLYAATASELELYVFDDSFDQVAEKDYRNLATAGRYIQDYHIFQTTKEEQLMRAVRLALEGARIPVESTKGEWGPGQEEINIVHSEALEMADRHVILKHATKEIAYAQGKSVTFMAKWRTDLAGSSSHIHMSLWKGQENLFADPSDPEGMSELFKWFLAGLLAHGAETTLLLAPTVNSYKRFQAASFAPTKLVWSRDNRTAGFRLVGEGKSLRVECRIPGADVNPYLAFAGLLAAGMHGVEQKLTLGPACQGDAYASNNVPEVPKTLAEAIEVFDKSEVMRSALGSEVVDHYAHSARWELAQFEREVTDWERRRYFERG